MRIPDGWLDYVAFFGGKDAAGLHYRATAFLIASPTLRTDHGGMALVTARHNVLRAQKIYGNVWVRVNMKDGGALDVEITEPWAFPADPACDVAAVPFWPPNGSELFPIPTEWFATEEVVEQKGIGIGDELFVSGLFSQHVGKSRNLPIVRSGNIASMPQESLVDDDTGEEYDAYLVEIRSIGGLSGSPVVVALNRYTRLNVFGDEEPLDPDDTWTFYLLGLIRGHWTRRVEADLHGSEAEALNTGIAIVTPISAVIPLLDREEFVNQREGVDAVYRQGDEVEDFLADPEVQEAVAEGEFDRFDALASKLVQVPKSEIDAKRKQEGS